MSNRNKGATIIYMFAVMITMTAFCTIGADYARVQLVKTELRRTADIAARAGAAVLPTGQAAARAEAIKFAGLNKADLGTNVVINNADVEIGKWNAVTKTLDKASPNPDAVRVTTRRTQARGNAVQLTFGWVIGMGQCDVNAVATAVYVTPLDVTADVAATANPWLAGMPANTVANPINPHNNPDWSAGTVGKPSASPLVINMPLVGNSTLNFGSIDGVANNDVNYDPNVNYSPDGNLGWIVNNRYAGGAEHGKSDIIAPINAVIGVFLDDSNPTMTSPPATLDFTTTASRNFTSLSPKLKQVFFIGDGRTDSGATQNFVVPAGATRFYIASMDEYEWNNNRGSRTYKITRPGRVVLVQ